MKRIALLVVLMLCVCTVGVWGQSPAPADKASFLSSLGAPAPQLAAARGRGQAKIFCSVTLNCPVGGYHATCTSQNNDCTANSNGVTCDGVFHPCPVCAETVECCDGSSFSCVGWSSCDSTLRNVTCDGHTYGNCPRLSQCG
jgi:hypothetical protein